MGIFMNRHMMNACAYVVDQLICCKNQKSNALFLKKYHVVADSFFFFSLIFLEAISCKVIL